MCDTTRNLAPCNAQSAHPQCLVAAARHAARHAANAVHGAPARLCIWSDCQQGPRSHHWHQRLCVPRHQCARGRDKVPMLEPLPHQQVPTAQFSECKLHLSNMDQVSCPAVGSVAAWRSNCSVQDAAPVPFFVCGRPVLGAPASLVPTKRPPPLVSHCFRAAAAASLLLCKPGTPCSGRDAAA